jgi:hypothetical protein
MVLRERVSGATVSPRVLNVLAALVWVVGGVVLLVKGGSLLAEALALKPGLAWPWVVMALGLLLGGLQARFVFSRSCERNLARIAALEEPKVWQFFRPGFFVALAAMIATGAILSRLAHGHHLLLVAVAALDWLLAVSLLGSSTVFWRERAFAA